MNQKVNNAPAKEDASDKSCFKPLGRWWALFLAILVFGIALRLWLYLSSDFTVGDAYITFRFAEQFAAGHGLVFNTGEWVGGNTSLLHSFLLGLGACTGLSVPVVARIESTIFDVLAFYFTWNVFRGATGLRLPLFQAVAVGIVFLCPLLFWYSVSGLETPLYVATIMFLLDRTLRGVDWVWHLAVTLLFFSRPDGIIVGAAALIYLTATTGRIPWRAVIGACAAGLAFLAVNYLLYHSLIPLTVKVKGVVYHNTVRDNFNYIVGRFYFHRSWLFIAFMGAMGLLMFLRRKQSRVLLLGGTAIGYLLFVLFAPTVRTWYVAPFLTLAISTVVVGGLALLEDLEWRHSRMAVSAAFIVYLLVSCYGYRSLDRECILWRSRIHDMPEAEGNWLRTNTPTDAKILVENLEVGYFAKRHTSDWPGLVSPEVFELVKANPNISYFEIANRLHLDYVGIHDTWGSEQGVKVPPNFKYLTTFKTSTTGPVMDMADAQDSYYQRISD